MKDSNIIFYTLVRSEYSKAQVNLLIQSLRMFGGDLANCPTWLFEANPDQISCEDLSGSGIEIFPLEAPKRVRHFYYHDKVFAGARAEELSAKSVESLIWIAPDCLILQPPERYILDQTVDAAMRPVHIQNVGLDPNAPTDGFWQGVYDRIGIQDVTQTIRTFVDHKTIRAYFNSHAFSIDPSLGLLQQWGEVFQDLVTDSQYQERHCSDERHQIFLHQAALTTVMISSISEDRLRVLPPEYNYPLNFQSELPEDRRVRRLNDLVTIAYEDLSLDPRTLGDIEVEEPLRSWLSEHAADLAQ